MSNCDKSTCVAKSTPDTTLALPVKGKSWFRMGEGKFIYLDSCCFRMYWCIKNFNYSSTES